MFKNYGVNEFIESYFEKHEQTDGVLEMCAGNLSKYQDKLLSKIPHSSLLRMPFIFKIFVESIYDSVSMSSLLHYTTNLEIIKYLISKGTNINKKTNKTENSLHMAGIRSDLKVIKYLVNQGVNINEKKTDKGENLLHMATLRSDFEVIKYFISQGVNINEKTYKGENVLLLAVLRSDLEVIKYFITLGVNINEKTNVGKMYCTWPLLGLTYKSSHI